MTQSKPCFYMTWTQEGDEISQKEMSKRYRKLASLEGSKLIARTIYETLKDDMQ